MDDLTEVENALRLALRHRPAPDGFTARVLARVAEVQNHEGAARRGERRQAGALLRMHPTAAWWSAAAAAVLLAVGGGNALHIRHQHQAQRARAAEAQVDLAMQLTNHALNEVTVNLSHSHAGQFTQMWIERP